MQDIMFMLCAVIVLCSPAACVMHRQDAIARAVAAGADPMAARCAMEIDTPSGACDRYMQALARQQERE